MIRKLSIALIACTFIVSCKGKQAVTDTPVDAGQSDLAANSNAVDSQPLSFDATGSDSGKIDGLTTVQFGYDKSSIDAGAKKTIASNAEWLKANPTTRVQIEGHCDQRGTIEYNVALGERRANAVKAYLVSLGIKADRLSTISYGKEKPVSAGDSEADMAKNRRANFVPAQ